MKKQILINTQKMGKGEGWGEGLGEGEGQNGNDWDHGILGCCKSPIHCKLKFNIRILDSYIELNFFVIL